MNVLKNVHSVNVKVEHPPEREPNTPQIKGDSARKLLGTLARLEGPSAAAEALGVTPQQARSAAHSKAPMLRDVVNQNVDRVKELALTRVMESLGLLDVDLMGSCSAKDLSLIAANMSRIVSNLSPHDGAAAPSKTLIIYAPHQREVDDFKVIDI